MQFIPKKHRITFEISITVYPSVRYSSLQLHTMSLNTRQLRIILQAMITTSTKGREKDDNKNKQASSIATKDPRRWKALLLLLSLAQFLVIMDTSIIGVAS